MKVVKWLAVIVVVLVLAFVIIGLVLPSSYQVERSVTIDAPPEVVFRYLNDLEQWEHWEPFSKADDSVVVTLGDVTTGVGATQTWTSNDGDGTLTFTMSDPDKGIGYDMQIGEFDPASAEITYEVVDGQVVVTWAMEGDMSLPVIGGYFGVMMDGMVGPMFDEGLRLLKEAAESDTPATPTDQPESGSSDAP
ncbi:MAG: SRPBCC family protein [Phycisphaerales bacterium JB063]